MSCSSDLIDFIARHRRIFVLTGAGCSTNSGIPDYRDREGNWKRTPPVTFQDFVGKAEIRQRYWARSQIGWPRFSRARPNPAHLALARLEERGQSELILTQNVDRLHQNAGSQAVIDLHGRLDQVRCLGCDGRVPRESFQLELERRNGRIILDEAATAPDGDADLVSQDLSDFSVPDCPSCGGMMKPDVVFFGENVPAERVRLAMSHVERADAMLVVGSSLMIMSGFRFVKQAAAAGLPIAAVNLGRTRADELLSVKIEQSCDLALRFLLDSV